MVLAAIVLGSDRTCGFIQRPSHSALSALFFWPPMIRLGSLVRNRPARKTGRRLGFSKTQCLLPRYGLGRLAMIARRAARRSFHFHLEQMPEEKCAYTHRRRMTDDNGMCEFGGLPPDDCTLRHVGGRNHMKPRPPWWSPRCGGARSDKSSYRPRKGRC